MAVRFKEPKSNLLSNIVFLNLLIYHTRLKLSSLFLFAPPTIPGTITAYQLDNPIIQKIKINNIKLPYQNTFCSLKYKRAGFSNIFNYFLYSIYKFGLTLLLYVIGSVVCEGGEVGWNDAAWPGGMGKWGDGEMEDWMNEVIFAWAHGSSYGTTGKNRNLNIPNSKERGTTALIKIQDPMNLPPHSPISPSPLLNKSSNNQETMKNKSRVNYQLSILMKRGDHNGTI
jgi:hypothetical protein